MRIIGWTYEADYHCNHCAELDGMDVDGAQDREGNEPRPVFSTDEVPTMGIFCGDCGEEIAEPYYHTYDGGQDWPDWSVVEECTCGHDFTDYEVMPDFCPECDKPTWELLADDCEVCGKPVDPSSTYYLGDSSEVVHLDCIGSVE